MMTRANVSLVALALAAGLWTIGQAAPAAAQNSQASGLPARGPPAASDIVPCQPVGSTLKGCTAQGIAGLAGSSVVTTPCNGVADDTGAIQAALSAGLPLLLPPGVCVVSSSLLVESYANNGQTIRGSGSYYSRGSVGFSTTPPPGTTVIRPTSAMSGKAVFIVDGTPIGGYQTTWVQGFGIENLAIDMVNMTDEATSIAIHQIQAWDGHYWNVRVLNDGSSKRAWLYSAGAFTTTMLNTQGNIVDMEGANAGYGVTTITVINHDGFQVITNWANGLKFIGGAYQGAGVHFNLDNTSDVDISTDVEGSGTYLQLGGYSVYIRSHAELGGMAVGFTEFAGTACQIDCELWDSTANGSNYVKKLTSGSIILNSQGTTGISTFLSGSASADYQVEIGRTIHDYLWGVAANADDYFTATAAGDMVLEGINSTGNLWLTAYQNANSINIEVTPTAVNIAGGTGSASFGGTVTGGYLHFGQAQGTPTANGQMFTLENAAGSAFYLCTTSSTLSVSYCALGGGASINGYSDTGFATLTWHINSASGGAQFQALTDQPASDGVALQINSAGGVSALSVITSSTATSDTVTTPGTVQAASYKAGSTAGVTCSGAPTGSFAATAGIVTHC